MCSKTTRHLEYTTDFHYVMATSLAAEQHRLGSRRLGQLLQAADVTRKSCDLEHGTANHSPDLCSFSVWQGHAFLLPQLLSWSSPPISSSLGLWCESHMSCKMLSASDSQREQGEAQKEAQSDSDTQGVCCVGGCGAGNIVRQRLLGVPPQVFTMQLAWQSASASQADIQAVMLGLRKVRGCLTFPGFCSASTPWYVQGHLQLSIQNLCFASALMLCIP